MKMTLTCCKCGFMKNINMGEWMADWIDKGEIEFHCGRCNVKEFMGRMKKERDRKIQERWEKEEKK